MNELIKSHVMGLPEIKNQQDNREETLTNHVGFI